MSNPPIRQRSWLGGRIAARPAGRHKRRYVLRPAVVATSTAEVVASTRLRRGRPAAPAASATKRAARRRALPCCAGSQKEGTPGLRPRAPCYAGPSGKRGAAAPPRCAGSQATDARRCRARPCFAGSQCYSARALAGACSRASPGLMKNERAWRRLAGCAGSRGDLRAAMPRSAVLRRAARATARAPLQDACDRASPAK